MPVDVHNWSATPRSGSVTLSPASHLAVADASQHYGPLAPGETKTLDFEVTSTDPSLPVNQETTMPITTTYGTHGSSAETLQLSVVPVTAIPRAGRTPTVDATEGPAEYPGPRLDLGRIWQGSNYCTGPSDCGVDEGGSAHHDWAKVSWSDDALYVFTHVVDDYQSYAVTPTECVAHWLADSVEIQVDPRGNASKNAMDTANTFKLGVFPFTDDPGGTNWNGANGPCWERDADHHQGYSTGPLADTVADAPNAPGVQVASSARWVGDNGTTTDHSYTGGGYDLEVKIPMADLSAAVDPQHIGLNITPYDNDDTAAGGTTTLVTSTTAPGWRGRRSAACSPTRTAGDRRRSTATHPRPTARPRWARRSWDIPTSTARSHRRRSPSRRATGCRSPVGRPPPRVSASPMSPGRSSATGACPCGSPRAAEGPHACTGTPATSTTRRCGAPRARVRPTRRRTGG